jgi:hypothetical protein
MKSTLVIFSAILLTTVLLGSAYAHKSQVIGNYKVEAGWEDEPPAVGKDNVIEIFVTKTTSADKMVKHDKPDDHATKKKSEHTHDESKKTKKKIKSHVAKKSVGVKGIKDLQVDVTLGGKKTFLEIKEDTKKPGRYFGSYTPQKEGHPTVHIFGMIRGTQIEGTFHPEKVEATK